jgi:polar amino acid transport system substrate-binding protein
MKLSLVFLVAILILCLAKPIPAETSFHIVYADKENPPRIMGNGSSIDWLKPGITPELLKMVEDRVGVQFKFSRAPWKRCLHMLKQGLADATFHASYKPARAEYGVYPTQGNALDSTRAIYKNSYVLYVLKESNILWDGKTITNATRPIGAQLSFAIADDLRQMGYRVEEERNVTLNLDKLVAGRISAYAEIESIVDNTIAANKKKYEMIKKLYPPIREKVYYLLISKAFAKEHPKITEAIWDSIRDVQQTDDYKKIIEKYLYR